MKARKITPAHTDARGSIADIMYKEPVDHIAVISSKKGAVRANHYHKETVQWIYLQSGSLESVTRREGEEPATLVMEPGDLICTEAGEHHAMRALEDSLFFVFTRGPRGGEDYESDTFRLDTPLIPYPETRP